MEPQLISSCPLSELFFEEEEDLMGSEISRIYFPTRKRDRTTISHEIHCEIILKRDTGIHGPLIWSEFSEENGGSGLWIPDSQFQNTDRFDVPWITTCPFFRLIRPSVDPPSSFGNSDEIGGPWIPMMHLFWTDSAVRGSPILL